MLGGVGIDRRLVYNVDWVLLGTTLVLSLVGVAMVYSATHAGRQPELYLKQLALVGVGLVGMALAAAIDYRRLADRAVLLYVLSLVALVYVLRFGPRDRRHAPLDPDRRRPAPALRARQARGRRVRGQGVLRVPPGVARPARRGRCRGRRWACWRC